MDVTATLDAVLSRRASAAPDAVALAEDDARHTYRWLDERVDEVASGLVAAGIAPGDRVGVLMASTSDHVVAVFAAWRAGATWVPLNPQVTDADLARCIGLTGTQLVVGDEAALERIGASDEPQVAGVATATVEALRTRPVDLPGARLEGDAVIAFTSGTTGRPKGAAITHRALRVHSAVVAEHYSAGPDDRLLTMLPLYLLSIFLIGPGLAVECGGTCRIVGRYSPQAFIRWSAADRTTLMAAVPLFFTDLLELPEADRAGLDLSSFRIVTSGGAPMPDEVMAAFGSRFGLRFLNVYGGTEAPGVVSLDPLDAPRRAGSVGVAMPHIRITAIDADGNDLPPGEIGDLCTAPVEEGPLAGLYEPMRGYWGDEAGTAEVLRGRRLRWGDVGYVDEDGFVFLVDRSKDVIIRGAMNVYPRQVEQVFHERAEVAEVAVVGGPDPRYGEVPVAFVRPAPGARVDAEELRAWVNERVAAYSRVVEVRVVADFPRNALGKVLKRDLREQLGAPVG
ncbi:MAG: class I adenylate-forming enzyme family protein [Acidimicrobiia bacterium]